MNSILEQTNSVCDSVRKSCDSPITFKNLLAKIRREFKNKDFDLIIKSKRQKFLNTEEFYVNAYYDAEDDRQNETAIEVLVYHNFPSSILWNKQQITDLLVQLYDAVVHELRHQRQSKKRKHATYSDHTHEPYAKYLADPDELDAYALSIAIELTRSLGKYRALGYLNRFEKLSKLKIKGVFVSPNLNAYISHFGGIESGLIKRLAKKVYIRLKKIDTDYVFV